MLRGQIGLWLPDDPREPQASQGAFINLEQQPASYGACYVMQTGQCDV